MAYEHKPNTGRVFPNDRRKDNDKAPHYTGELVVDRAGKFEVSMWVNYGEDGKVKNVSLRLGDPYVKPDAPRTIGEPERRQPVLNDDVPFAPEFR